MNKLKRYDMDFVSNEEYHELLPIESEDGKWVKYKDVEKMVKRINKRLKSISEKMSKTRNK